MAKTAPRKESFKAIRESDLTAGCVGLTLLLMATGACDTGVDSRPDGASGGASNASGGAPNIAYGGQAPHSDSAGGSGGQLNPQTYTPVVINFDDLDSGDYVTDQYAQYAIFSSDSDCDFEVTSDASLAESNPYYIFSYYSCAEGSSAPLHVAFTKPVRNFSFKAVGVNFGNKVATVKVTHGGGTIEQDMIGHGSYSTPVIVDLSAYEDVTRLDVVDVDDDYGLGFDDFAFDFPN